MANMSTIRISENIFFCGKYTRKRIYKKRRLSAAAPRLIERKNVTQPPKYGYDSASSFTRAFKEFYRIFAQ